MAPRSNLRPRLSFLDRLLLDEEVDSVSSPRRDLERLRGAVRRDLEALLNCRRWSRSWPATAGELEQSVLGYGLLDMHSQPLATEAQRDLFRRHIEDVILRFEPRFRSVSVALLQNVEEVDRTLRFRIQAVLRADADGEPVVYDTQLDPALRSFTVTDANHG